MQERDIWLDKLLTLLNADEQRMSILKQVSSLNIEQCYVAAGFIRNMVWDELHNRPVTTLNDVDVIYFDETGKNKETEIEMSLRQLNPNQNWEVKNQAFMHVKHGDKPYKDCSEAMQHWPEKETAIAARLKSSSSGECSQIEVVAPFGLETLFKGHLTHNPVRSEGVFNQRVSNKNWLKMWPKLKLVRKQDSR